MIQHCAKTTMAVMMALLGSTAALAQIPAGYYAPLKGKKGAALKTAVHEIIKNADVLDYGSGSGRTWEGFYTTDQAADGMVIDRYSNDKRYFGSKGSAVSGMNIEHSFPKSWWGGSTVQAYKDLYNLMPCEQKINSSKSNYPMGKVTTVKTDNGCTRIGTGHNGYQLWEPADQWKGDFARGYMYMATAYQNYTWSGEQGLQILEKGDYPTLKEWAYTLYIEWARTDKVTADEVKRNNEVSKIQGNRNPFVDFPNLMEYIWGDSVNYAFDPEKTVCSEDYTGGGEGQEPGPGPAEETVIYDCLYTTDNGGCIILNRQLPPNNSSVWQLTTQYGWKGTAFYNNTNHAAEAILLTPVIDLSGYDKATLWFEHAVNFCTSPSTTLSVEIYCNGEYTTLNGIAWPAGNSWTFKESGDIDLSSFAGKSIQVAFRYRSTDSESATWEVKHVKVTAAVDLAGISTPAAMTDGPDLSQPYEAYSTDGRRVDISTTRGLIIIRQKGRTWKIMRP